jgi:hypothetical protein
MLFVSREYLPESGGSRPAFQDGRPLTAEALVALGLSS